MLAENGIFYEFSILFSVNFLGDTTGMVEEKKMLELRFLLLLRFASGPKYSSACLVRPLLIRLLSSQRRG